MDDWDSRVRFPPGLGIFIFTTVSRKALGTTQPPIQWVPGALSLRVKQPGREADHSPPSSAEVRNTLPLGVEVGYGNKKSVLNVTNHLPLLIRFSFNHLTLRPPENTNIHEIQSMAVCVCLCC
jgi:hypothetical protein